MEFLAPNECWYFISLIRTSSNIFAQIFLIRRSSVKIPRTIVLGIPPSFSIIRTLNSWFLSKTWRTSCTVSSVCDIEVRFERSAWLVDSWPSRSLLCHMKIWLFFIPPPHVPSISTVSELFLPSFTMVAQSCPNIWSMLSRWRTSTRGLTLPQQLTVNNGRRSSPSNPSLPNQRC